MEEEQAIELLKNSIGKNHGYGENPAGRKKLVEVLGYLPLAIFTAGKKIKRKSISIEECIKEYQQTNLSPPSSTIQLDEEMIKETVRKTFNCDFDELKKDCPETLFILKKSSFLASSSIPISLLTEPGFSDRPEELKKWSEIAEKINQYSWMKINPEAQTAYIHPVLQYFIREKVNQSHERKKYLECIMASQKSGFFRYPGQSKEAIIFRQMLLPHMEKTIEHYKKNFNKATLQCDTCEEIDKRLNALYLDILDYMGIIYFYYQNNKKKSLGFLKESLRYRLEFQKSSIQLAIQKKIWPRSCGNSWKFSQCAWRT